MTSAGVQFAIAHDAHFRDLADLFADQFEDRAAEVAGDAVVGARPAQGIGQKRPVKPLTSGGEAPDHSARISWYRRTALTVARQVIVRLASPAQEPAYGH